jgi:hypothetical protein
MTSLLLARHRIPTPDTFVLSRRDAAAAVVAREVPHHRAGGDQRVQHAEPQGRRLEGAAGDGPQQHPLRIGLAADNGAWHRGRLLAALRALGAEPVLFSLALAEGGEVATVAGEGAPGEVGEAGRERAQRRGEQAQDTLGKGELFAPHP